MAQSSANASPLDIAISGAGPGGLSAAHAMANRGFSVGIFDRAQFLRPIGAALGLAEHGYAALNAISPDLSKSTVQSHQSKATTAHAAKKRSNGSLQCNPPLH